MATVFKTSRATGLGPTLWTVTTNAGRLFGLNAGDWCLIVVGLVLSSLLLMIA